MRARLSVVEGPRRFIAVLGAMAVLGLALIGIGWRGVAASVLVVEQLPYLVSGGLVGTALIGAALALLSVHTDRVEAARERRDLADLQRDALRLLAVATTKDPQ